MKRKTSITVETNYGRIKGDVTFHFDSKFNTLAAHEQQSVVDEISEQVMSAIRSGPYTPQVPLRNVRVKW